MARVPYLTREELPPDKQGIYDRIAEPRGGITNVFRAMLNSPDAASVVAEVGAYVRYGSALDPMVKEIAILSTAREQRAHSEWAHHVPLAREAGVGEDVIAAIRSGRAPMGLPAREGMYAQAAREIVSQEGLSDRTYQALEHLLGTRSTLDFIVLVAYYPAVSRIISALRVELEEGLESDLP